MRAASVGKRKILQQGEKSWLWELSTEELGSTGFSTQSSVRSISPQSPTSTVIYENVPSDRALIDDLLNEQEYSDEHWRSYGALLVSLATITEDRDVAWSVDQIERTHRYIATSDDQDKLSRLSKGILQTIDPFDESTDVAPFRNDYPILAGVPIGLGRVVLDSKKDGIVLAPPGAVAPKAATAGRLIEELIWISTLVRPKNYRKADQAINLAVSVANASLKYSDLLHYSTLLAFSAHVQRRLTAPMAPQETVEVFWPAIEQVYNRPTDFGLPWRGLT